MSFVICCDMLYVLLFVVIFGVCKKSKSQFPCHIELLLLYVHCTKTLRFQNSDYFFNLGFKNMISGSTKVYTVIGNPITHSLSPELHNYWLRENSINGIYNKEKF